jgi:uncharacterized protein (TIGR02246 family)
MKLRFCPATLVLLVAIASPGKAAAQDSRTLLRSELAASAKGWNDADIERHVVIYADSATMTGATGLIRGRNAIRDLLLQAFWVNGKPLQQLSFDDVEVRLLGNGDAAIVTGKFILTGGGRAESSGRFSTTWERRNGRWLTIHDHSS